MEPQSLNIVSLDVPYPPDYGGVIDIFHKVRALHRQGVQLFLHCFEYGDRRAREELEAYCQEVYYYPRRTGMMSQISLLPYITFSRRNPQLTARLQSNAHPILLEGLHTVFPLVNRQLDGRTVLVRCHNIEHHYYRYLADRERNKINKLFFLKEALLLKRLLHRLPKTTHMAAISPSDATYFKQRFPNTFWLPPFHSSRHFGMLSGSGTYALYHGNLSVSENAEVAEMLMRCFSGKRVPLVVAGKNPGSLLLDLASEAKNITVVVDPDAARMEQLIQHAHVILLVTNQPTGIKLKLLESLHRGRFCLANRTMVEHTGLERLVEREEDDFYGKTLELMKVPFTERHLLQRKKLLGASYDNDQNAMLLMRQLGVNKKKT